MKVTREKFKISFTEPLLGSSPADQEIFTRFVASKAPAEWLTTEESDTLPERNDSTGVTVFHEDENGLFLYNYLVKGFLKESGNNLKDCGDIGVKNLRSKIDNYVFVQPRRIYLVRDGKRIIEPDRMLERPLRGMTPLGPRVSLVSSEAVDPPVEIEFTVELVENKEVTFEIIHKLLDYGALKGMGQWRNGGWGTFTWEELPN